MISKKPHELSKLFYSEISELSYSDTEFCWIFVNICQYDQCQQLFCEIP